jgi:hypothetical protein
MYLNSVGEAASGRGLRARGARLDGLADVVVHPRACEAIDENAGLRDGMGWPKLQHEMTGPWKECMVNARRGTFLGPSVDLN